MFTVTNNIEALDNLYFEPCVRSESGGSVTVVTERRTGKEVPEQLSLTTTEGTHITEPHLTIYKTWKPEPTPAAAAVSMKLMRMYICIRV